MKISFRTYLAWAVAFGCLASTAPASAEVLDLGTLTVKPALGRNAEPRAAYSNLKLLRSWIKNGEKSEPTGDVVPVGLAISLAGETTVKCPRDTKCLVELTLSVFMASETGGSFAPGWAVDNPNFEAALVQQVGELDRQGATWTYARKIGPGSHVVTPAVACVSGDCIYGRHALTIRLYKF